MEQPDDLLTVKQAAELLTVSVHAIRDWILRKKLPIVRVGGRSIRIRRSVALALIVDEKTA